MQTFSLDRNPFRIVGAVLESTLSEISDLVDDATLDGDVAEADLLKAQQTLVTPRLRISAELSWLLGLSRKQQSRLFEDLRQGKIEPLLKSLELLPELAAANIAAHLCGSGRGSSEFIHLMAQAWSDLDEDYHLTVLNRARQAAGMPQVQMEPFKDALLELRQVHARTAIGWLWSTPHSGETMLRIVRHELQNNADGAFLRVLVKEYDAASDGQLSQIEESIHLEIEAAKASPPRSPSQVQAIAGLLERWDKVNQPVQLYEQRIGREEARSRRVCESVRSLALELANEHDQYQAALGLTQALLRTFPELESIAQQLRDDVAALTHLIKESAKQRLLDPLFAAVEAAKKDVGSLRADLLANGFSDHRPGVLSKLVKAFRAAQAGLEDKAFAYVAIRDLALSLNNKSNDPELGFKLVREMLRVGEHQMPPEIRRQLNEDQLILFRNWMGRALQQQSNRRALEKTATDLLAFAQGPERRELERLLGRLKRQKVGGFLRVGVFVGIAGFVIYIAQQDIGTSSRPTTSNGLGLVTPASASADSYQEAMPPVGRGRTLSTPEIRYCVFQSERLNILYDLALSNYEIGRYNRLVDDYNSRCSDFRYRAGALRPVEDQVAARRSQLQADAERIRSSW